jgi:hypothetical protein
MADEPEPPPLPLQMDEDDAERVSRFLDTVDSVANQRLLIEILDCLRSIDDKLGRLLAAGRPDRGR